MNKLPIVGITMGDPAGIGPEVIVKALAHKSIYEICRPFVIGNAAVMRRAAGFAASDIKVNQIDSIVDTKLEFGTMDVLDYAKADITQFETGKVSAEAGRAAFEAIKTAILLAMNGVIDATCTAPINKESINAAGHKYAGHTEIYADLTGTKDYAMLLIDGPLRVVHVTTHVQLRKACDQVTRQRVLMTIKLADDACKGFGIERPRVGVAALNPHAGESGLFGWEEEKEIRPAVEDALKLGILADGPVPADTLFSKARGGLYDVCVAMYHDQGHIPLKLAGFQWDDAEKRMVQVSGINITLGLPIIRTSVDHGTAFDKAGKGIAAEGSMVMAIEYAARMATRRPR